MDHGMMDHDTTGDMSGSADMVDPFCTGNGRVMLPGFQLGANGGACVLFLFQGAIVNTAVRYGFAVLGAFLIAFTVELLRWFRTHTSKREFSVVREAGELALDACLFVLYAAQMCLAYWLMLLVMLYEYGFFIAIVGGLGFGLVFTRVLDRRFFPDSVAHVAHGTPCCDGGQATGSATSTTKLQTV